MSKKILDYFYELFQYCFWLSILAKVPSLNLIFLTNISLIIEETLFPILMFVDNRFFF